LIWISFLRTHTYAVGALPSWKQKQNAINYRASQSRYLSKPWGTSARTRGVDDTLQPTRGFHTLPIALLRRKPWGEPYQACINTPQNEVWLSAIRNAGVYMFIQTPDLNAKPLLSELLAAARRGISVTYYVCLGYNDAGELLSFQGGTNKIVANQLYSELEPDHPKNLHVGYYVGKDQVMPIHNRFRSRSCHIKLMIVDGHIDIQGNGNQDTQSWFHSQEVNILIDSKGAVRKWEEGIRRNQSLKRFSST
jgi:phosphatidylserine/phosphatidylglycerophosphate/cardiolipin synthase-like enzyme